MTVQYESTYNFMAAPTKRIHDLVGEGKLDRGDTIRVLNTILETLTPVVSNIESYINSVSVIASATEKEEKKKSLNSLLIQFNQFVETLENDLNDLSISEESSVRRNFEKKLVEQLKGIEQRLHTQKLDLKELERQIQYLYDTTERFRTQLQESNDADFIRQHHAHQGGLVHILMGLFGLSILIPGLVPINPPPPNPVVPVEEVQLNSNKHSSVSNKSKTQLPDVSEPLYDEIQNLQPTSVSENEHSSVSNTSKTQVPDVSDSSREARQQLGIALVVEAVSKLGDDNRKTTENPEN